MFSHGSKFRSKRTLPEPVIGCRSEGWGEAIIHSTKFSYEKILTSFSSSGILQIDFCNAFNSIKRSEMLKTVAILMPGIAAFTNFYYLLHSHFFYYRSVVSSGSGI